MSCARRFPKSPRSGSLGARDADPPVRVAGTHPVTRATERVLTSGSSSGPAPTSLASSRSRAAAPPPRSARLPRDDDSGGRDFRVRLHSPLDAPGQRGELAVEALGLLEVRHMADAFVPGGLGGRAGGEDVLGHRRQHDRVRPAVRDEQRHLERRAARRRRRSRAPRGRRGSAPARRCSSRSPSRGRRPRPAWPGTPSRRSAWRGCWSAGRRPSRRRKWSRKPGPISVPNAASPSLTAPSTKLIAAIRSCPCART